jgi:predicted ester cyclase
MTNKKIIQSFFENVRSGQNVNSAPQYMHNIVYAHQVLAESHTDEVIERSPEDYANHVQEMKAMYGDFSLAIEEILSDGDKVYVRWRQVGTVDKKDVTEIGSAVYLLKDGKIAEYWIQLDRKGIEEQMNN